MKSIHKIMASLFAFILIAVGWMAMPQDTHAFHAPAVYFEVAPHEVSQEDANQNDMDTVRTTVRNADHWRFSTPICVTEWVNNQAWHRGCVESVFFNGQDSFTFDVTRNFAGGSLVYSYQHPDGQWQAVMEENHNLVHYNAPN